MNKYGITLEQYENVLKDCSDKENGLNDMEYQDIVEKYGMKIHYDSLRKSQQTPFGTVKATQYLLSKQDGNKSNIEKVKDILGEQYIVKQQIHNESVKLNRYKREFVPSISVAEELSNIIKNENFKIEVPEYSYYPVMETSEYTMIANISDWHIGCVIDNCCGNSFNWEIANNRVDKYIFECKKYIRMYGIKRVYVINTGDVVEQVYMRGTQESSCEFLLSMQIAKAEKLIFRLLVELSKDCEVIYGGISGNHDRMCGDKKRNYAGDNVNIIINENIKDLITASGTKRISVINSEYSTNEIRLNINGFNCRFIHGDGIPKMDKNNFAKMMSAENEFFDLVFGGHYHNFSLLTENHGRYMISTGCLSGFNDYSKDFYCTSDASQTICVIGNNEIEMVKDVNLA